MRAVERRRELERRRRRRARHSDDDGKKRRRSINVHAQDKYAWLYKTRRNAVIEVTLDGHVQTTTNRSSAYCTSRCSSDS